MWKKHHSLKKKKPELEWRFWGLFFDTRGCGDREGENAPGYSSSFRFLAFWDLFRIIHITGASTASPQKYLIRQYKNNRSYWIIANVIKLSSMQEAGKRALWSWCRDVYLQTVMRFFLSTPTLRADAFFDVRPRAIAVWRHPDSMQPRPRGLFGILGQARSPPSPPVSYK